MGLQVDIRIVSQLCLRTSVVLCCRVWFVVVVVVAVAAAVAVAAVAAVAAFAAAVAFAVVVAVVLVWSGLARDSLEGFGLGILMGQWVIVCLRPSSSLPSKLYLYVLRNFVASLCLPISLIAQSYGLRVLTLLDPGLLY